MSKKKIATLATVAAAAGTIGMMGNQALTVQAATTDAATKATVATTTTDGQQAVSQAATKTTTAKQAVSQATSTATSAQTAANDASAAKATAQKTLNSASSSVQAASDAQKQAVATKAAATPENITNAQQAVSDASTVQSQAQSQATSTATTVSQAQADVNAKSSAVTAAQQELTQAQNKVKQVTTTAQNTVDQDKASVATQTKAVSDAQNVQNQANNTVVKAQTTVKTAQTAVDATNAKIKNADSSVEVGGIVMPSGYKEAYAKRADLYGKAFDAVYDENGDNWDAANDAGNKALEPLVAIQKKVVKIDYQPTVADKAEKVPEISNLTESQVRELSDFTASMMNDVRKQLGFTPIKVSDGSAKLGYLLINKNAGDGETFSAMGGNEPAVKQGVGAQVGVPFFDFDSNEGDQLEYGEGLNIQIEDCAGESWKLYRTNDHTMADLKAGIADYIYEQLSTDNGTVTVFNSPASYGSFPDLMLTEPGNNYFYGAMGDLVHDYKTRELYLSTTYDATGLIHVILYTNDDNDIPKGSIFFKNTTTPAPISHVAPENSALEVTLKSQTKALTTAKASLISAQNDLKTAASKTSVATDKLTSLKQQLAADEAGLKQVQNTKAFVSAKAAVTAAKAKIAVATAELTTAKQTLATAKAADDKAQTALKAATDKVAKAKAYLLNLENADTTLTTANEDLAQAQAAYEAAQADYDEKVTAADTTSAALATAKEAVATAKANLAQATAREQALKAVETAAQADRITTGQPKVQNLVMTNNVSTTSAAHVTKTVATVGTTEGNAAKSLKAKAGAAALPQTDEQSTSFLSLLGMMLLGLFGFAGVGLKRKRN